MIVRKASLNEYDLVREFYYQVIDGFQGKEYQPMWEKDIYPSRDQLKELLSKDEMYIGVEDDKIIAAMAFNHDCNEGYEKISWKVNATSDEVFIIHMLGVHPDYNGKGKAKEMVQFCIGEAKANGAKALRLDVLLGNIPANRLYEQFGFLKLETVTMFYPDTGNMDFELYELVL